MTEHNDAYFAAIVRGARKGIVLYLPEPKRKAMLVAALPGGRQITTMKRIARQRFDRPMDVIVRIEFLD